jgi:hypothetical protein
LKFHATFLKGNIMSRSELLNQLFALEERRQEYFDQGLWDKVDFIQLCIDDTQDAIKALS